MLAKQEVAGGGSRESRLSSSEEPRLVISSICNPGKEY